MLLNSEMSKGEKEAQINKIINEIQKKNAEIIERHKEVEKDKKNAEKLSQNALMRMKQDTSCENKNLTTGRKADSKKECKVNLSDKTTTKNQEDAESVSIYRPQRLSENDAPPPDPVFSYLTDRLREGAFCSPITIETKIRKISSSTSSNNSSRKTSTASNSSWTSSASSSSSKYNGFADYQLPWNYSSSKNIKNQFRKNSSNSEMKNERLRSQHMDLEEEKRENIILDEHNNEIRTINVPICTVIGTATEKRNKRDYGRWKSQSCTENQETRKSYNWRDSCLN